MKYVWYLIILLALAFGLDYFGVVYIPWFHLDKPDVQIENPVKGTKRSRQAIEENLEEKPDDDRW